jgi:hypothetical protein
MISDTSLALLSGLVGSVLTVFVTKILDIVQKRQEHRHSLQKLFFEKKLQAADSAMALFSNVSTAAKATKTLFELITDERLLTSKFYIGLLFNEIQSIVEKFRIHDISSLPLCFDLEKDEECIYILMNIIHSWSSLEILHMKLKAVNKGMNNIDDEKKARDLVIKHFEVLSENIEAIEKTISNYSDKIRLDLKRFKA